MISNWPKKVNDASSMKSNEGDIIYDQAVILKITFNSLSEFGSDEEQSAIAYLEGHINSVLPAGSGVDGHEYGDGEAIIYIYGTSADGIFNTIEDVLKKSMFDHIDVTLQYGQPDNPDTIDKKFTL